MRHHIAALAALYFVAACAAPAPEPIKGEPRYDKFGNYECDIIPGTNTCIPDDDEEPCFYPDGTPVPPGIPCFPPPTGDDDDDSSTSGGGTTPGTAPGRG
ncbi:hypothetical protein [Cognatishimia maritima]|uniref:Uncharacterized protein n=1 Tax=Cognatishimia maritima TaxID=870908 RepID=A0A1M5JSR5_9RHOB|nr:hypothetical protein [Cognatishimia maritima]SHG43319.1 hypothetical protein SAMN04488044_0766 [Cognatishimia maritima]